jgi:preprotein translocase subunit SecF
VTVTVTDAAGRASDASTVLAVVPAVAVPQGGSGGAIFGFALTNYGYLLVGVLAGALVTWGVAGPVLARRRARREGDAIVRAMNREIQARQHDGPKEP